MSQNDARMDRREFLNKSATVLAAGAAFSSTASSYGRILGANDRISLGHIGFGNRGRNLAEIASMLQKTHNVEIQTEPVTVDCPEYNAGNLPRRIF